MRSGAPLVCAIDAQISPDVAGGTETALLSLITALGRRAGEERFVVIGMPSHLHELRPYLGATESVITWPDRYAWYTPDGRGRATPAVWDRLRKASGPLASMIDAVHDRYAHGRPLGPLAEKLTRRLGPAGPLVPPVARLYHGWRARRVAARLTRRQADARLRAAGAEVIHFPYPHHFPTSLPFVYEPWGLPHAHFPEQFAPGERA